jgi:hypothetical protein
VRQPLREVTETSSTVGRGSLLGGDTFRRIRMWNLALTCGHTVQRRVRYRPDPRRRRGGSAPVRAMADALPAPVRVRCEECPRPVPLEEAVTNA